MKNSLCIKSKTLKNWANTLDNNKLKKLELYCSKLSTFCLDHLEKLEHLEIHSQRLKELPSGIFELPNLKVLKLKNVPIEIFPEVVGHFCGIEQVMMIGGMLTEVTPSISKLTKLFHLNLSSNKLQSLPTLPLSLKRLVLDDNQFQKIPLNINQLGHLEFLSLEGNPFSNEDKMKLEKIYAISA